MRRIVTAALLSALVFAVPGAAQEQRGAIEGTVRDAQGAMIPGAVRHVGDEGYGREKRC